MGDAYVNHTIGRSADPVSPEALRLLTYGRNYAARYQQEVLPMFTTPKPTNDTDRPHRHGRGFLLGACVTAAVIAGAVLAPAAANAATPSTAAAAQSAPSNPASPQVSRGFHIWNLTGHPMKVDSIKGNAQYEGRPKVGHILQPGQMDDWEVQFNENYDSTSIVHYSILNNDGTVAGSYDPTMTVSSTYGFPPRYTATATNGFVVSGLEMDLVVMAPDGTVTNPQAQAYMLRSLCNNGLAACTFTDIKREQLTTPKHQVWKGTTVGADGPGTVPIAVSDTTNFTINVNTPVTVDGPLFKAIANGIKAQYKQDWVGTRTQTANVNVPINATSVISAVAPLYRDTGTITIKVEGHTWALPGVSFDSPDTTRTGTWIVDTSPGH